MYSLYGVSLIIYFLKNQAREAMTRVLGLSFSRLTLSCRGAASVDVTRLEGYLRLVKGVLDNWRRVRGQNAS